MYEYAATVERVVDGDTVDGRAGNVKVFTGDLADFLCHIQHMVNGLCSEFISAIS